MIFARRSLHHYVIMTDAALYISLNRKEQEIPKTCAVFFFTGLEKRNEEKRKRGFVR